ncbi:hypothetical protein Pla175_37940 [Pirellulimonas nuda]|uniref:Uncharacterized protein n=1 Tax=Pirellulimonas nuda TaxID=2528009 RepID=A0A518DFY1_9BACT|nr:hypothetical protein [Pirellulimonas nuda]QDU90390.1 hypothetical protein Pla175_37940 [Pirellulimonas nuda]
MTRQQVRGLTLAEVVMSTFLIGLLLTGALRSVGASAKSWTAAAEAADGQALAQQLMAEIVGQPYEEQTQSPAFGPESGEVVTAGVRSGLDDLDDYNDWVDTPPKDRSGAALTGFAGWSRTADVQKTWPDDYSIRSDGGSDKGMRLVTVIATSPTGRKSTLKAYRTNAGGSLQPQGVQQTLVTWVGASLQAAGGPAVQGGTALPNHASDQ